MENSKVNQRVDITYSDIRPFFFPDNQGEDHPVRRGIYNTVIQRVKPFSALDEVPQSKDWR